MVQSDTVLERDSLADKMNDKQSKQTMLRIVLVAPVIDHDGNF
jgi:hypothetical protein